MDAVFERRVTDVEQFFRAINENTTSPNHPDPSGCIDVVCECALVDCTEVVHVPVDAFESVREQRGWFVVLPEHALSAGSVIVEELDSYWVVSRPALPDADPTALPAASPSAVSVDRLLLTALTNAIAERDDGGSGGLARERELAALRA